MVKGLPKKYAKMGFAKGWKAYRKSKNNVSRVRTMAKGKTRTITRYVKKKYAKARKGGLTLSNVTKVLTGAALAALYEVFVSPMIPVDTMMKNIAELGIGLFLASAPRMHKSVRAFGAALATINAYSLVVPYIQNLRGVAE